MHDLSEALDTLHGKSALDAQGTPLGDSTNLPQAWREFDESLWETLTFQPNINAPSRWDHVGLSLAIQCSDTKARDIAKSEMQLWRRSRSRAGAWEIVEPGQHWFADMLAGDPNEVHTWDEFWRMVIIHLDFAQEAFILKDIDRVGNVLQLIPLPTGRCRARVSTTGRLFYEVWAGNEFDRARIGDDIIVVPADRMIHLRGRMWNGLTGLSNSALGEGLFGLASAIHKFQTQLFGNEARQPIVFESDSAVFGTGEQADAAFRRLKQQLTERVRRMSAYGDPILLEAGYKAKIVAQNAREAMTAEAFTGVVQRVCGLMNMLPHKIAATESVKYDNLATAENQYANQCLFPITNAIQRRFLRELFTAEERRRYSPEFDQMALMAGDAKTLMDILDKGVKAGLIEVNEARERLPLGLNPIKGGDVRYVPVNVAIVDREGNVIQQAATGQNQGAGQGEQDEEGEEPAPAQRALRVIAGGAE